MHSQKLLSIAALCLGLAIVGATPGLAEPANKARYIVTFRPDKSEEGRRAVRESGGAVRRSLDRHRSMAAEMPAEQAARLAGNPNVERVEIDPRRYPTSIMRARASGADRMISAKGPDSQIVPYGVTMVQAESYKGRPGRPIRVCVIDSGYDLGHEDKPGKRVVQGADDPGGAGPWTQDGDGHGTHVSGIINALDNHLGVLGVFPGSRMYVVRVFGNDGNWAYSSDLVAALDRCMAAGAKVINMSLGGDEPSELENLAFREAEKAGVLSVAAAGNGGDTARLYPAS
jgi:serine protease